jgi:hypothetical protein
MSFIFQVFKFIYILISIMFKSKRSGAGFSIFLSIVFMKQMMLGILEFKVCLPLH